jgi:hypothetical protein
MVEPIRISMSSQVIGLYGAVDIDGIRRSLNSYVQEHKDRLNLEILQGWRLLFNILSIPSTNIGVLKRVRKYPSDQEFEIPLYISIPNNNEASYGLASVHESVFAPLNDEKKFYILPPLYEAYTNLYDYILESGKRALYLSFTTGLVMNGKKLQLLN